MKYHSPNYERKSEMKIYRKILDIIVKTATILVMLFVSGIVLIMMYELILRNVANKSFRPTTELCGFLFMWMAFIGLIILYDEERLISLDMVYTRVNQTVQKIFWYFTKVFSLVLGVTMVLSYCNMYPILSTSYFSTMQFLSKAWQFLPMAIAGGFIVFDTIYQVLDKTIGLLRGKGGLK